MMTVLRRVWARAVTRAMEVASVPFLQNIAQSAWVTMPVKASASSTIRPVGPVRVSPISIWRTKAALISGWP